MLVNQKEGDFIVIDYSYVSGKFFREGACNDAIRIEKYTEMGDPNDPGYPDDFQGIPAITIERQYGKNIDLLFDNSDDRNTMYDKLVKQL